MRYVRVTKQQNPKTNPNEWVELKVDFRFQVKTKINSNSDYVFVVMWVKGWVHTRINA